MAPPKRYWVKVKAPPSFLATLPHFTTPVSKSRLKKLAAEEKKNGPSTSASGNSKTSSPQPEQNYRINSGLKESSTSGLTMNSIANGSFSLDKTGKPCRKWVKKSHSFKTFSGFKVDYVSYNGEDIKENTQSQPQPQEQEPKQQEINQSNDRDNSYDSPMTPVKEEVAV